MASARGFARLVTERIPKFCVSTDHALDHDPDRCLVFDSDPDLVLGGNLSHYQFLSQRNYTVSPHLLKANTCELAIEQKTNIGALKILAPLKKYIVKTEILSIIILADIRTRNHMRKYQGQGLISGGAYNKSEREEASAIQTYIESNLLKAIDNRYTFNLGNGHKSLEENSGERGGCSSISKPASQITALAVADL
ncbi:hypothetical protein EVAR_6434_1 [Eumeta japonica]|uniref:Uncharacterized protein n=1 Tax=Eumeta variegata TaxID=151549 RepID=A0A4C1TFS5_EUMVA|nr:hypothetical protein EVAR_6434_1 [Eumeta japonica]